MGSAVANSPFLLVPVNNKNYVIIPKRSIIRIYEDEQGVCVECKINKSIMYIRPPATVPMGKIVEALNPTHVYREMG